MNYYFVNDITKEKSFSDEIKNIHHFSLKQLKPSIFVRRDFGHIYKHKTELRKTISKMKLTQKNTMLIRKESNMKKQLENEYVFRRKIYLHEKHSDHSFF